MSVAIQPPVTPDGRYMVVRGRLWRRGNPHLSDDERKKLVSSLMRSRRAVRDALKAGDEQALAQTRADVDAAKAALGERGPPWWDDGTPDLNRHPVRNTLYAAWYDSIPAG